MWFAPGERVQVATAKGWRPGVVEQVASPNDLYVRLDDGTTVKVRRSNVIDADALPQGSVKRWTPSAPNGP